MFPEHKFTLAYEYGKYKFFIPHKSSEYHTRRYVELIKQEHYNSAGGNKEVFARIAESLKTLAVTHKDIVKLSQDVITLATQIEIRSKYPIDQHCCIRMGCIGTFLQYKDDRSQDIILEDPNDYNQFFQQKKEDLALSVPELYDFFLRMGIGLSQTYEELRKGLDVEAYISSRSIAIAELIKTMPPIPEPKSIKR